MSAETGQSFDDPSNLYKILGVNKDADDDAIKKAYRKLALQHHPDRHHGVDSSNHMEKFQLINTAHKILSDKGKRRIYDAYGMKGVQFWEGHNADSLPSFVFKKWFKPVFYTIFLLSCCCCCCCCGCIFCCGFCCNFCCGKYAREEAYGDTTANGIHENDEEITTQRENISESLSNNIVIPLSNSEVKEQEHTNNKQKNDDSS
uniref:J domain-containing protein n=1 Tax=Parastrongyloides trichosuri TaxID=131310 RepID=A0A0N5A0L3_PARTI